MNLVKVLSIVCLLLLPACSFDVKQEDVDKVKDVFNEQLDNLYYLYETKGKDLLANLTFDNAKKMLDGVLDKIPEDKKEIAYKGIEKGIVLLEDGKEILADKLEIDLSVEGVKEEIEQFLDKLASVDARLSLGNVVIEKVDDKYKLDCTVNFYYNSDKNR